MLFPFWYVEKVTDAPVKARDSPAVASCGQTGSVIRAAPWGGPAAFCQLQASLLNRPSPSARPSIFPFEGGTIGFEAAPGLAASFPTPSVCIPSMVRFPSIFRHFFRHFSALIRVFRPEHPGYLVDSSGCNACNGGYIIGGASGPDHGSDKLRVFSSGRVRRWRHIQQTAPVLLHGMQQFRRKDVRRVGINTQDAPPSMLGFVKPLL